MPHLPSPRRHPNKATFSILTPRAIPLELPKASIIPSRFKTARLCSHRNPCKPLPFRTSRRQRTYPEGIDRMMTKPNLGLTTSLGTAASTVKKLHMDMARSCSMMMVERGIWDRQQGVNGYVRYVRFPIGKRRALTYMKPEPTVSTPFGQLKDGRYGVMGTVPFPFGKVDGSAIVEAMRQELPSRADARLLVDCYYRHMSWK